ncbi:hypothetical protein PJJ30_24110 [Mycobacterium kansasii]|uniref:Uncharacterized protein n=1 Tax=Mycobacterium persicum TaxID=1487726 RepID=A0ABY6RSI6_9MYCO|nr:hypothetical protein [Mycobacterium persicum]VAZ77478.1 hypothetical protein LAUMK15_03850 [Mycobacterium persicum]VBA33003.1 hypothetical protein LAUMK4_05845 [Mycobacterium persicum]
MASEKQMTHKDLFGVAAREAEEGRKVLWFARNRQSRFNALCRLAELLPTGAKAYRAHGRERITFASGGEVVFISGDGCGRGHVADTLIFDDTPVHQDALPCIAGNADGRVFTTGD